MGINNRDIMALERDGGTVATTSALAVCKPENAVLISESGIQSPAEVRAALAAWAMTGCMLALPILMAEDPLFSCYRTLSIAGEYRQMTPQLRSRPSADRGRGALL